MLKRSRIPLLTVMAVLIFASCTKTNKQGRYLPKDAGFVLHIDGASLNAKLPWSEIKQNPLFQQLYADSATPVFIKQALDSPDNSGIDIKGDLAFYVQNDTTGSIAAFTGTIKDAEKFRLFNLDATKGGSESEKDGIKFISKSPVCVGYNKERFLYIINHENYDFVNHQQGKARDLLTTCSGLFDLKESNSLGENEKFTALVKTTGDLHIWMNAENTANLKGFNMKMPMMDLNKLTKGNITTAIVNFENGKILIATKSYAGKEMADFYKKFSGKNFDEEMVKRLPTKDVAAVFALGYNPEAINDFIKVLGLEGLTPLVPKFAGFSVEEFIKANKGDVVIAIGDFKTKKDSPYVTKDSLGSPTMHGELFNTIPDFTFVTSVGDKDAFNKLIKAGEKFSGPFLTAFNISYNTDGKYFALSNSKENVDKYFEKTSSNNFDFLSKISGNPLGGYINFQYIMKAFESDITKDSTAKLIYDASLKTWDNAFIKGGNYDDGGITQSIEINLMDKNTNSLKQLNQYVGFLKKLERDFKKKVKAPYMDAEDVMKDNIAMPPAPVSK